MKNTEILLSFPCDKDIANHFCKKIKGMQASAIILKKQEGYLNKLLSSCGVKNIYTLNENFYGQISCDETRSTLREIRNKKFKRSYFPLNTFCANAALLHSLLTPEVIALNPTSLTPIGIKLQEADIDVSGIWKQKDISPIEQKIIEKQKKILPNFKDKNFLNLGERPSTGLMQNFPYDCELVSYYGYASGEVKGNVLEIGCGIGYGAYLLAELNSKIMIRAVDYDLQTIKLAQSIWPDNHRLIFEKAKAEDLPFENGSFDTVVAFEVIEHIKQTHKFLKEVKRILKKGGKLIGSTPNFKLHPYIVNKSKSSNIIKLRQLGIWPWHIREFNENKISSLLRQNGFTQVSIKYPTFIKGIRLWKEIRESSFDTGVKILSKLKWSAADFYALDKYYPLFSGFSFIFTGFKL